MAGPVSLPAGVEHLISHAPKVELHVHLEGTLEPAMMLDLAARNGVTAPFASVEEAAAAYRFSDLRSFLDIYYEGASVLMTEQDFYDLTAAYARRMAASGVVHVEPFFDPQSHTSRGVAFETVVTGISRALDDARKDLGVSSLLIMSFLRDMTQDDALATLAQAEPYLHLIAGVGLDSAEVGNPPGKFAAVFERARELGLHAVAHAGEEGPPQFVADALDLLHAERIDHGIATIQDPDLTARLARDRTPLTVCPFSNMRLRVVYELEAHPIKRMLDAGLAVCVNSDDPAYFGGYLDDNLVATAAALDLTAAEVAKLLANAIRGSFLDTAAQQELLLRLDAAYDEATGR